MGVTSAGVVSAQQAGAQNNFALSAIKQNAKVEQELVSMIAQSSSETRGQNLDVTV